MYLTQRETTLVFYNLRAKDSMFSLFWQFYQNEVLLILTYAIMTSASLRKSDKTSAESLLRGQAQK